MEGAEHTGGMLELPCAAGCSASLPRGGGKGERVGSAVLGSAVPHNRQLGTVKQQPRHTLPSHCPPRQAMSSAPNWQPAPGAPGSSAGDGAAGSACRGSCGAIAGGDGGGTTAGGSPPARPTWWNRREELRSTVQPGTWQDTAGRGLEATGGGACAAAVALADAVRPGRAAAIVVGEAPAAADASWAILSLESRSCGGRSAPELLNI